MSFFGSVPTQDGVIFSANTSAPPKVSMIFGHVPLRWQRSRMPPGWMSRTLSGKLCHHCGPSLPIWYSSSTPSGMPQRELFATRRPAISGQAPSCTMRPDSSSFIPRKIRWRVKFPDCDEPRMISLLTMPAIGFGVPKSSVLAYLKKEPTSRKAAVPAPRTYGSFALYTSWYSLLPSKPFFRQRLTGRLVGVVAVAYVWPALQNFQSLFGIVSPGVMTPFTVSFRWTVRLACDWSSAGKYGIGFPMTFNGCPGCAPVLVRLTIRPMIRPVVPTSLGVFTHSLVLGVTGVSDEAFAGTTVAPALSPCQP